MQTVLENKVVCVTGAARRVGRAIALEFAKQGANIVIHFHTSEIEALETAKLAREFGVDVLLSKADQSNPTDLENMFQAINAHYGRLDVMVNSAAVFKRSPFLDISYSEWNSVLGVNLAGPFLCTQHAARLMISQKCCGSIINISDNSGLRPWEARSHHSVAKAGLIMLTQVSALSLAQHNIRVNCIVPGPVLRPSGEPEAVLSQIANSLPLKRIGNPKDVANACVFFAFNDFTTGSLLRVDGGEGLVGGET